MRRTTKRTALLQALASQAEALRERAEFLEDRYNLRVLPLTRSIPMAHERPAKELHGAAGLIGLSVLADSAVEHYRGSFQNSAMWLPLASSALNILASGHAIGERRPGNHHARTAIYAAAIAIGATGTGFHLYNVGKRVGGWRWENLFYGAPLGAPAALMLSGLSGLAADRLAGNAKKTGRATLLGLHAGRIVAAITSIGLLGTTGEAGLLHFRGNFQNPAMMLPVTMPPVAAAFMAEAALGDSGRSRRMARGWLGLTSLMGFAGTAFHAYGVARMMGGWRNWRQNLVDGPPLPAPPSFSGLAIGGLAALKLIARGAR